MSLTKMSWINLVQGISVLLFLIYCYFWFTVVTEFGDSDTLITDLLITDLLLTLTLVVVSMSGFGINRLENRLHKVNKLYICFHKFSSALYIILTKVAQFQGFIIIGV